MFARGFQDIQRFQSAADVDIVVEIAGGRDVQQETRNILSSQSGRSLLLEHYLFHGWISQLDVNDLFVDDCEALIFAQRR